MKTPYQQGLEQGTWPLELFQASGWPSPLECLKNEERNYEEAMRERIPALYKVNPPWAKIQAEYLEGAITATRRDLKAMETNLNMERGRRFYQLLPEPNARYEEAKQQLEEHRAKLATLIADDEDYATELASIEFLQGFLSCFEEKQ